MSAILSNGVDQRLINESVDNLDMYPITIAGWVKSFSGLSHSVCSVWGGANNYNYVQAANETGGDPMRAISYNGSAGIATTSSGFTTETWTHVCSVFTSATSRAVYIDGNSVGTNSTSIVHALPITAFIVGVQNKTAVSRGDFKVGHFAVWTAALTQADALVLASGTLPSDVVAESLVSYWYLFSDGTDEQDAYHLTNEGEVAFDLSDNPPVATPPTIESFEIGSILGKQINIGLFVETVGGGEHYPGDLVCFKVEADGIGPFTYTWYKDGDIIDDSLALDQSEYYFYSDESSGGNYYCVVSNDAGSVQTDSIEVTMLDPGNQWVSPTTYVDEASQWSSETNAFDGDTSTGASDYIIEYSGWLDLVLPSEGICSKVRFLCTKMSSADGQPYAYVEAWVGGEWVSVYENTVHLGSQWYEVDFADVTTDTFRFRLRNSQLSSSDMFLYEFQVWQSYPPTITDQTISGVQYFGQTVNLQITTSGTEPITYQWYKNSLPISGATNNTYTFIVSSIGEDTYTCIATNSYGSDTSDPIVITQETSPYRYNLFNLQFDFDRINDE